MNEIKELFRRFVVFILTLEAKAVLRKYHPKVVLVTGSVGKTITKDSVYTALASSFFVRKSEKSFNSDIGVPLTILGVPNGWSNPFRWIKNIIEGFFLLVMHAPYPKWLVMEIGADRPGDISRSLVWLKPDVVVATRFPDVSVHVEFYASPEAVIEEELAASRWLTDGGVFVANADDPRAKSAKTRDGVTRITYGFAKDSSVRGMRFHLNSTQKMPSGVSFDAVYQNERAHVSLDTVLGEQHASAALAGIAAAIGVGIPLAKAAEVFSKHDSPSGRMHLIAGMRGSVIIDDTYNASPAAVEKALETLKEVPRMGKRIALLADMLELGAYSVEEHARIGRLAAECADALITVGIRARGIASAAREAGMPGDSVFECERGADAASQAISLIGEGDVVLVKGSQSMRMERVVKSLMARPEHAKDLLVRQETEWSIR